MASAGRERPQEPSQPPRGAAQPDAAVAEAQQWIEQATGRNFGDKDFRSGLENGVLLCELLNTIKPGVVKKINRLSTPIAGLDNIALFLRGCKELGLKGSQLFDPGDLQDTSSKATTKNLDGSRKLKNVLVTLYWLGKTANSSTSYSGATLNLKEFEGLLDQMRKETEDVESPKRSIRDSGYIDCWDTERSDSLSPPCHGRDDSFDSLDSFGSRSQQTPSPDVVLRGSSDGRGSDSESDLPHRKIPDMKKDDMSARRISCGEPKSVVPFNQYLPNKSNQTAYIPAPLKKKKAEREEYRKSWSTATSPLGGEAPFSKSRPEAIGEEGSDALAQLEEEFSGNGNPPGRTDPRLSARGPLPRSPTRSANKAAGSRNAEKDPQKFRKLRQLEQAGIKVMSAAQRYGSSQKHIYETSDPTPDIILRKENPFILCYQRKDTGSEDERDERMPDLEKDDFAIRRAKLNQPKCTLPFSQYLLGPYTKKEQGERGKGKKQKMKQECASGDRASPKKVALQEEKPFLQSRGEEDLSRRKTQASPSQLDLSVLTKGCLTQADKETWDRLKVSGETSDEELIDTQDTFLSSETAVEAANRNDFASHRARIYKKASSPRQRFVHFGPVTEIEHQKWENLPTANVEAKDDLEKAANRERTGAVETSNEPSCSETHVESIGHEETHRPHADTSEMIWSSKDSYNSDVCADSGKQTLSSLNEWHESSDEELDGSFPDIERDDMLARRFGTFQKCSSPVRPSCPPISVVGHHPLKQQGNITLRKSSPKAESIIITDTVSTEKYPEICAERPERVALSLEHALEQDRQSPPSIIQADAPSPAPKDVFDPELVQPAHLSAEMQGALERTGKEFTSLKDDHTQIFGSRTPVSDDAESVSMFDMRCSDDSAVMQPHSKARHEKLQAVHHQLKEDDDQWQDDLARWKSRRRSASQDLLKKEAERKKMERLLSAGDGTSERRKSIKTYKEIVEEKERRERELHEAYKNARSHEEAENILQQYIERFTISEAVLERLEMPKILERSYSAEPNSTSLPKDPNPLRYLRQQSLPAPKYTAKVEATIVPTSEPEASISSGCASPSKPFVSKAVPVLTPKPYSQPKSTQQVLKSFKVDRKVSMNGDTFNGVEEEKEREYAALIFAPSPSQSPNSDNVMEEDGASEGSLSEESKQINQKDKSSSEGASPVGLTSDHKDFNTAVSCASPTVATVEFSSLSNHSKEMGSNDDLKKQEAEKQKDAEAPVTQKAEDPEQDGNRAYPSVQKVPESSRTLLQNSTLQADTESNEKTSHFGGWCWDPEEERKRQQRWQHEQERLLQERYQKEQDKLKEEWERAQKEVEEEERRYYEEERKIIEDTVVPFTVTSNSTEPFSTSSSVTDGNGAMNILDLSNSEETDKQKEEKTPKKLFCEQEDTPFTQNKEHELWKENMSINKVRYLEANNRRGNEQDHLTSMPECKPPPPLPLCQEVPSNQQLLTKQSPCVSDTRQKTSSLRSNLGLPINSTKEVKRASCQETSQTGPPSPCSPVVQSQSPNRSISGRKLCSSCGQALGKGAAMIIETLGLYFHIQCFRCGICKGQLGDAASGTDVRIRNGLLNCNNCYIRSRTTGQPTTL
ncbi:LIM and calponin homology domains-containing protein 1 isoform X2 [Eublepharis macularius]|uniref:LIM and calponin homology domains-containing protein 1 isoform X2 n=1 Tax=Eublepharis macularius TaxID=481883 RepID=A0AA97JZL9_EUBMA|nr:LIM and calponin homology domains-containing protein 1 isoform X2 [Eublepharis macularius]